MSAGGSATDRRRAPAALFLFCCGIAGIAPHWLSPFRSLLPALSLAALLGGYSIRTVLVRHSSQASDKSPSGAGAESDPESTASSPSLPAVDVVIAARDEEAVDSGSDLSLIHI